MKLLTTLIIAATLFCGCTTFQSYKTLQVTAVTVDNARAYYAEQIVLGKVSQEKQDKIDKVIKDYQSAFRSAVAAARFDYKAATPKTVSELANQILTSIGEIAQ